MGLVDRIKELSKKQGHTIASLERELGFGNGAIRKWDVSSPTAENLMKVATFLSTSMDYLMTGENKALNMEPEALLVASEWSKLDERTKRIIQGEIYRKVDELNRLDEHAEEFHIERKAT